MSEMIKMPISINVLAYSRPKSDLRYLPVDQGHREAAQVSGADRPRRSQNHRRHWHRCTSGWDLPAVLTLTLVVERPWQPHHAGQIVRSAFATYNDAGIRRPGTVPRLSWLRPCNSAGGPPALQYPA